MIDHIQQLEQQLESASIVRAGLEEAARRCDEVTQSLIEAREAEAACRAELIAAIGAELGVLENAA